MTFTKKCKYLLLFLIIAMALNKEQVESRLRKLGVTFTEKYDWSNIESHFKEFQENVLLDQKIKHEEEIEKKRNTIFRQRLLSRVSGSILHDFYGRF